MNKVYEAIVDYMSKHQYPPTVRELCKLTGYASTSTIFIKLKMLEEKGCIELGKGFARGIKVKAKTNYDRIRNMSVEEMASLLLDGCRGAECDNQPINEYGSVDCFKCRKQWLESEVDINDR